MMLAEQVRTRGETGARAALRLATDAVHQRMHGLEPFARIEAGSLPIGQYRLLLRSLLLFHSAVGEAVHQGGWSRLSSVGSRLERLRSDIAFLGGSAAPAANWHPGSGEALLGALYVAEGSMFGGRVIARQLDYLFAAEPDGRRFFIGATDDKASWSRLIAELEARCGRPHRLDAAISGALRTFDWFEQCVGRAFPADRQLFDYCVPGARAACCQTMTSARPLLPKPSVAMT